MPLSVAEIMERFVAAGGRRTATRQAIVEAVIEAGGHVTADDITAVVRQRFPSVSESTVYRTLEALEELEVVDHVHLGHGRAVFHLAEEGHHHLYCERCERVESLPEDRVAPLARVLEREHGFRLQHRHFALVGLCRQCAEGD